MTNPPPVVQILLLLIVIPAALFDARERRVPNWIVLAGIVLGIGLNWFLYETPGLWMSLRGFGLAFAIYLPLYFLRGMGAGDVKLMGAVGSIVGAANWLGILVITSIVGAVAAIGLILVRGRFRQTFQNIGVILISLRSREAPFEKNPQLDVRDNRGLRMPHAAVIACGSIGFLIAAAIWAPR